MDALLNARSIAERVAFFHAVRSKYNLRRFTKLLEILVLLRDCEHDFDASSQKTGEDVGLEDESRGEALIDWDQDRLHSSRSSQL